MLATNSPESGVLGAEAPRVLLTDTNRWALSARLAIEVSQVGCQVSAACPMPGHALLKTRAVQRTFRYSGLRPLESLTAAIEAVEPEIVIPCCDRSVGHLHELFARAQSQGAAGSKMAALIERSLGSPASYPTVSSRYDLLALAREEGVRVPSTSRVNTPEELADWKEREAFPWVLKADGTWGGGGVKIVRSRDEIQKSLAQLARMFGFGRVIKRLLVNRDPFWLRPWWNRSQHAVIAQSYIEGHAANCAVVCWKGQVLAGIAVEVVSSEGLTGPASVVRIVNNPEMMFAAERVAARLGLSGFFGLDFMIEARRGAAYLIEMNPRSTPLCHLRLGHKRDMAGALWAQLAGQPDPKTPSVTQNDMIAYFPQAWNSKSELLESSFQDIPLEEPDLIQELRRPWPDRTLLFRLCTRRTQPAWPSKGGDPDKTADPVDLKTCEVPGCTSRPAPSDTMDKESV
jgi:glutathione synthase/RimK-type ligase-like ATP-grasp enzyme